MGFQMASLEICVSVGQVHGYKEGTYVIYQGHGYHGHGLSHMVCVSVGHCTSGRGHCMGPRWVPEQCTKWNARGQGFYA